MAEVRLDDVLALAEPARTNAIKAFLEQDASFDSNEVKIRSNDGKAFKFRHAGRVVVIPPAGKHFPRRAAIDLLMRYGRDGRFYGMDRETGMTVGKWTSMPVKNREIFGTYVPEFQTQYLTHDLGPEVEEDATETE